MLGLFTTARCSGRRCDRAPDVRRALHPHLRPGRDQCRRARPADLRRLCPQTPTRTTAPAVTATRQPWRTHTCAATCSRPRPTPLPAALLRLPRCGDRGRPRTQRRGGPACWWHTPTGRRPEQPRSCVLQLSLDQNCTRAAHRLSGEQPAPRRLPVLGSRAGTVRNNFEVAGHRGAQVRESLWITVLAAGDERWRFGSSTVRLPQSPTVVSHHRAPCPPVVQAPHSASHNAVRSITAGHSDLIPHTHGMGGPFTVSLGSGTPAFIRPIWGRDPPGVSPGTHPSANRGARPVGLSAFARAGSCNTARRTGRAPSPCRCGRRRRSPTRRRSSPGPRAARP